MLYPFDPVALGTAQVLSERLSSHRVWDASMGVPLMGEDAHFAAWLNGIYNSLENSNQSQILFFYINEREKGSPSVSESNRKVLKQLKIENSQPIAIRDYLNHTLVFINGTLDIWKLKEKEGVGRARKVVGDAALYLYKEKRINSSLHRQSDGDVRLPPQYFNAKLPPEFVAATYPFMHSQGDLSVLEYEGLLQYEAHLRSYVEGLKFAGSPFAFWALGSTLIFDLLAYEKVRGVPNTQAGEDFYFLNKMVGVGKVGELAGHKEMTLTITGRKSDRVPFGTGRAIENMDKGSAYETYPAAVFEKLKILLVQFTELSEHRDLTLFLSQVGEDEIMNSLTPAFEKILKQKTRPQQTLFQLHQAFNGLQTFRWVRRHSGAEMTIKAQQIQTRNR